MGVVTLTVIAAASVVGVTLLRRDPPVRPVDQDRSGPVLLVPGYGGSTLALEVFADALDAAGRDVRIVEENGPGTGDLRDRAGDLDRAVEATLEETGASSVDIVGYSAGGVVLRIYVADLDGGSTVRRAITLASPLGYSVQSVCRPEGRAPRRAAGPRDHRDGHIRPRHPPARPAELVGVRGRIGRCSAVSR